MAIIPLSRDGRPVYFVLEGNVNPRDAEERGLSLVYPNPQPSNFSYAKARHTEDTLGRTLTLSFGTLCSTSLFSSSNLLFSGNLPE